MGDGPQQQIKWRNIQQAALGQYEMAQQNLALQGLQQAAPPQILHNILGSALLAPNCYQPPAQQWGQSAYVPPDPEADRKAEELMLRNLSDEQRASWERHKGFWAVAKSGNRYWLDCYKPRGFTVDGPPQSFCIYSIDEAGQQLPACDQILAHKLLIETDEEAFLKTANASRL